MLMQVHVVPADFSEAKWRTDDFNRQYQGDQRCNDNHVLQWRGRGPVCVPHSANRELFDLSDMVVACTSQELTGRRAKLRLLARAVLVCPPLAPLRCSWPLDLSKASALCVLPNQCVCAGRG